MNNPIEPVTIATIKEVQKLFNPSPSKATASRYISLVRDAMNVRIVTMDVFCQYYGLK